MDDTSQVQGPPAPGEEPTHADFKPVTLAPSPPPSESVEQSQSTQMKVPDFVRDLPIEHQAVQQQSGQQPAAVVTTWREQLPTASTSESPRSRSFSLLSRSRLWKSNPVTLPRWHRSTLPLAIRTATSTHSLMKA